MIFALAWQNAGFGMIYAGEQVAVSSLVGDTSVVSTYGNMVSTEGPCTAGFAGMLLTASQTPSNAEQ